MELWSALQWCLSLSWFDGTAAWRRNGLPSSRMYVGLDYHFVVAKPFAFLIIGRQRNARVGTRPGVSLLTLFVEISFPLTCMAASWNKAEHLHWHDSCRSRCGQRVRSSGHRQSYFAPRALRINEKEIAMRPRCRAVGDVRPLY